jgi:hypothetical protein
MIDRKSAGRGGGEGLAASRTVMAGELAVVATVAGSR